MPINRLLKDSDDVELLAVAFHLALRELQLLDPFAISSLVRSLRPLSMALAILKKLPVVR